MAFVKSVHFDGQARHPQFSAWQSRPAGLQHPQSTKEENRMTENEVSEIMMTSYRTVIFTGSAWLAQKSYGMPLDDPGVQQRIEAACTRALAAAAADKSLSSSDREAAATVAALPFPMATSVPMSDNTMTASRFLTVYAEVAAPWFGPIQKSIEFVRLF